MQVPVLAGRVPPALPLPPGWTHDDQIDADLMALVRDHDHHDALANLLPRIGLAINGPLFRYLSAAEIDDGRAEVHFRIWSRRHLYRKDRGTVRAWVGGISRHYALGWLRKHSRTPRLLDSLSGLAIADVHPDPALSAEEADWAAHVHRMCSEVLSSFPPHVQACFRLRMQGIAYATIARLVGPSPIGTVATAVHRVRKKLLALLEKSLNPIPKTGESVMVIDARITSLQDEIDQLKARLAATEARMVQAEARLAAVETNSSEKEQEASPLPPTPAALASRLLDRLRVLVNDPTQHRSETAWAEVEDLVEGLRPVMKHFPKGLFIKVVTRLKESRELLKKARGHGAALAQVRGVVTLLESVADGGLEDGGVIASR